MFEEFFNKCDILDPENVSAAQSEKIMSALQKRVADESQQIQSTKEDKSMKTKTIRTIIIAAVAAVVGTIGIVGAASTILTREQVIDKLGQNNSLNDKYYQITEQFSEERGEDTWVFPTYEDMDIGEYFVTDENLSKFDYFGDKYGIILVHEGKRDDGNDYGIAYGILLDGNGGYKFDNNNPVEDEKLLAAIAEGIEKYGDHFFIWY